MRRHPDVPGEVERDARLEAAEALNRRAHPEWFADLIDGSTACLPDGCTKEPAATSACLTVAAQLCTARPGWDGPTGLGEPRYLPWL